jgi:hypothetical protein
MIMALAVLSGLNRAAITVSCGGVAVRLEAIKLSTATSQPELTDAGVPFIYSDLTLRIGGALPIRMPDSDINLFRLRLKAFRDKASKKVVVVLLRDYFPQGDCDPAEARCYAYAHGRAEFLGAVGSLDGINFPDLDGDGEPEIVRNFLVGADVDMSIAERPRWHDVFSLRGCRIHEADKRYPRLYRDWESSVTDVMRRYPLDRDLWAYYDYERRLTNPWETGAARLRHEKERVVCLLELNRQGDESEIRRNILEVRRLTHLHGRNQPDLPIDDEDISPGP